MFHGDFFRNPIGIGISLGTDDKSFDLILKLLENTSLFAIALAEEMRKRSVMESRLQRQEALIERIQLENIELLHQIGEVVARAQYEAESAVDETYAVIVSLLIAMGIFESEDQARDAFDLQEMQMYISRMMSLTQGHALYWKLRRYVVSLGLSPLDWKKKTMIGLLIAEGMRESAFEVLIEEWRFEITADELDIEAVAEMAEAVGDEEEDEEE